MKTATVVIGALAATMLAACSPSTGATVAPVIATTALAAPPVTVTAPPPVTVTVKPPPTVIPVAHEVSASGPFQSPSGNIQCTMFTSTDGLSNARCAVIQHDWVATQPGNCQMNWGDRVDLEENAAVTFGCYGQGMPAPTHTLEYGQYQTLGSLSCTSETVGIMCIDNGTGHYFSVSRETAHLG